MRFFEEATGWEAFGDFQPSHVHNRTSIVFWTPAYKTVDISTPVRVKIQLQRPSDEVLSEALDFEMLPLIEGEGAID